MKDNDEIYVEANIALFEAIYGKNLISLGGIPAIEGLFSGIDIKGKHALDIGFGLGGVAIYLATHHSMNVDGVEVHPWMVQHATRQIPKQLVAQLKFSTYDSEGHLPYPQNQFDIIYSKGVMNHIHDKRSVLREIKRVLKPEGQLVIADWVHEKLEKDSSQPLVKETQASYRQQLDEAGFVNIKIENHSKLFLSYVDTLLVHMQEQEKTFTSSFGKSTYDEIIQQQQRLKQELQAKMKHAVRIIAFSH